MTPTEWMGLVVGASATAGSLVGWGIAWGTTRTKLRTLDANHGELKKKFDGHKDNHKIHIDPDRDIRALEDLKEMMLANFAETRASDNEMKATLREVNQRCERRGAECAAHFASVERKVAAATGKANGS